MTESIPAPGERGDEIDEVAARLQDVLHRLGDGGEEIECPCGHSFPDLPELSCCPFCAASLVEEEDEPACAACAVAATETALVPRGNVNMVRAQDESRRICDEIARLTANRFEQCWHLGRLFTEYRDRRYWEIIDHFESFEDWCEMATPHALRSIYRYMAYYKAIPEETMKQLDGISLGAINEMMRQARHVKDFYPTPIGAIWKYFTDKRIADANTSEKQVRAVKKAAEKIAEKAEPIVRKVKSKPVAESAPAAEPPRRGRPPGSKNKPKSEEAKPTKPRPNGRGKRALEAALAEIPAGPPPKSMKAQIEQEMEATLNPPFVEITDTFPTAFRLDYRAQSGRDFNPDLDRPDQKQIHMQLGGYLFRFELRKHGVFLTLSPVE